MDRSRIERLNPRNRVVVGQLKVLWEEDGIDLKDLHPYREVGANEIREILRSGLPVAIVTTEHRWEWGGSRLKWIRGSDRFDFWKKELQPHLMEPDDPRPGDAFPDDYFYKATEWRWEGKNMPYCIVLTQYH